MFIKKLHQQVICNHHEPIAHTPLGQLRGVKTEDAYIFRGIRYAHARRFHMPEAEEAWEGVRDAIIYGFVCPEITTPVPHDQFTVPHVFYPQHEDCQYLNVWTQSLDENAKRPVMVWLHGGGYATGSGIEHYAYDGEELSKAKNVVVVTLNHRLNVLGYLDLSAYGEEYALSGNVGMADIVEANPRQLNLACAEIIADYDQPSQAAFVEMAHGHNCQFNKALMQYIARKCPPPTAEKYAIFTAWREARTATEKKKQTPPKHITFTRKKFEPYLAKFGSDAELEKLFLEFLRERAG